MAIPLEKKLQSDKLDIQQLQKLEQEMNSEGPRWPTVHWIPSEELANALFFFMTLRIMCLALY